MSPRMLNHNKNSAKSLSQKLIMSQGTTIVRHYTLVHGLIQRSLPIFSFIPACIGARLGEEGGGGDRGVLGAYIKNKNYYFT